MLLKKEGNHASPQTKCSSAHKLKNSKNFALQQTKKKILTKRTKFYFCSLTHNISKDVVIKKTNYFLLFFFNAKYLIFR